MRGKRKKRFRDKQRKSIYILPNLFTTAALFAGFFAIVQAMQGDFERAAMAIFIAMVLDGAQHVGTAEPVGARVRELELGVVAAREHRFQVASLGLPGRLAHQAALAETNAARAAPPGSGQPRPAARRRLGGLEPAHRDPAHAPARDLVHRELEVVETQPLAGAWHVAQLGQHEAAHGAHVVPGELVPQDALELGQAHDRGLTSAGGR